MTIDEYMSLLGKGEAFKQRLIEAWSSEDGTIDDIINSYIEPLTKTMNIVPLPFKNAHFYRARYDSDNWTDKNDLSQYGYIHNAEVISLFRYNKDHEQVLYTSTSPYTAFDEIFDHNKNGKNVYISKWRKKNCDKVLCVYPTIYPEVPKRSIAERYYEALLCNPVNFDTKLSRKVGLILEAECIDNYDGLNYKFSSAIASKFLLGSDALLTVSKKSSNTELNVTFKKDVTDNDLEIQAVYEVENPTCRNELNRVCKIGIPQDGHLKWYRYEVETDTIKIIKYGQLKISAPDIITDYSKRKSLRKYKYTLYPNINLAITDCHIGLVYNECGDYLCTVLFKIRLYEN